MVVRYIDTTDTLHLLSSHLGVPLACSTSYHYMLLGFTQMGCAVQTTVFHHMSQHSVLH